MKNGENKIFSISWLGCQGNVYHLFHNVYRYDLPKPISSLMSNRSSKIEPVRESYGANTMFVQIFVCSAMIILILCSQTYVRSYKHEIKVLTKLRNKPDTIF